MSDLRLTLRSGSTTLDLVLDPGQAHRIGRRTDHTICIAEDAAISRDHAELRWQARSVIKGGSTTVGSLGFWTIRDLGSRHGTRLNGLRIPSNRVVPIADGDLVLVGESELRCGPKSVTGRSIAQTLETGHETVVAPSIERVSPAQHRLALLVTLSERLHGAENENDLAELLAQAVIEGAGLPNAAVLQPPDEEGNVEILAERGAITDGGRPRLSRSLLRRAAAGELVVSAGGGSLGGGSGGPITPGGQSLIDLRIAAAGGAPIECGGRVHSVLYAKRRDQTPATSGTETAEFLGALAKIGGVALAGIRRLELERRYRDIEADLAIAAAAQQFLLREVDQVDEGVRIQGRSRPGRVVGGDFFRVMRRGPNVWRIVLGDVSGKGVGAAVLMSALHGYVGGEMRRVDRLDELAASMAEFVEAHRHGHTFVTVWLADLDLGSNSIRYVDAGHGHAMLWTPGGEATPLVEGGGPPFGVMPGAEYEIAEVPWPEGSRMIVVSDGLIEQTSAQGREEFGRSRLAAWLASESATEVGTIFEAVAAHAGSDELADDATAVLVSR
ncbi:MAG: SpoIIE family protein phosphatase [Phycisphaerales bacterium]